MTSILAIRVPEDWATLEAITNLFSTYGNITLGKDNGKRFKFNQSFSSARVLRPGRAIPPDLRNYATQIPDMGATTCAVVDFDSTDSGLFIFFIGTLSNYYYSTRVLPRSPRQKPSRHAYRAFGTTNSTHVVQGGKEKGWFRLLAITYSGCKIGKK